MALITDLPTNASPSTSDYMITDTGSATQKCTINNIFAAVKSQPIQGYVNLATSYSNSIGAYIKANVPNNTLTPLVFTNANDLSTTTAGVCLIWRTNLTSSGVALIWVSGASNSSSVAMERLTLPA